MPTHRGIKVSVVSQLELKLHPEFPHPESSQFTYRSPDLRKGTAKFADWTPPSTSSDSKADRLLGRQSVVSVYIPSMPATRFWIRYNILEAATTHSEWFYFKLFMNGRHITSWGTNAKIRPSGQVMRGLFEPSERWNYKHEGTVFRNMGTEARPFIFGHEERDGSAANDGGLIEVMVFRARGRKRRLPKPTDFKPQEGYGIVMPSGGLLEKPQDAKFYDWHLKDPKDNPFATFKFHYRSWDNLTSLQLIPDNHPRTLLPASPSVLSLNGASQELQSKLEEDTDEEEKGVIAQLKRSMSSTIISDPWLTSVFDDSPERPLSNQDHRSALVVPTDTSPIFSGRRGAEAPLSRFSAAVIDKPASPQNSWKGYLDRPLPEVPTRNSSLRQQQRTNPSGHSRTSSAISHAPSIAASLLPYLERDTVSPEPILGVAQVVEVSASPTIPTFTPTPSSPSLDTIDSPQPATNPTKSKRQGIASPPLNTLFSMTNITVRKTRRSPSKRLSKQSQAPTETLDFYSPSPSYSPCPAPARPPTETFSTFADDHDNDNDQPALDISQNTTTLSISESEWMCRTPSPVKALPRFGSLQKMWSPGLGKRASRDTSLSMMGMEVVTEKENENSYENGNGIGDEHLGLRSRRKGSRDTAFKKKATEWYGKAKAPSRDDLPEEAFENKSQRPMEGNWI
ncbi:hypothetical protein BKA65DRAFT_182018 [Rhexocercosporidium sp. MPI-PUGE-AT-0058]|nr:hypothetical protein BKA65DRAFT_182018 [Rhexocercosporidium sp. MPI-PUGE-AT-0058]